MYTPDRQTFLARAAHGNLVPVWRELLADQESPVSAYRRLRSALQAEQAAPYTFLLESVEGGEHVARYSFLGGRPRTVIAGYGRRVEVERGDGSREVLEDVDSLAVLKEHMAQYRPVPDPDLPPFFGGAVGYIGYDAVPQFEPTVPLSDGDRCEWPDLLFLITDTIVVFDRARHTIKVVANAFIEGDAEAAYDDAVSRIERLCESLSTPVPYAVIDAGGDLPVVEHESNVERAVFEQSVEKAKEYIRAGDVIQVVLSQRFSADHAGSPLDVYRALRAVNPSPYMFCLELGTRAIIGSSPEIHVRCEDGQVEIRPIAGTRRRSRDPEKDRLLEEELLADPKERAEHVMLVDLARNDIGRVCDYGSVKVSELMVIERYSHVMHIVTDVVGRLGAAYDGYDLMRATFPAGTVSGAPKVRAMEIIAELETDTRGPYAGTVAYFGFTGNLDSCITIRTILLENGRAHVQAGAGIVADSDPAFEYEETRNKARGMLKALALARRFDEARSEEFVMILVIDNYDSFTFNLVQYLGELGADLKVLRNDQVTLDEAIALKPDRVLVSPGPCTPNEAGVSCKIIEHFGKHVPVFGVCLGHQCIGHVYGGNVVRAGRLMHGKTSEILHDGSGVLQGMPNPFEATRYHSLLVERASLPPVLRITAETDQGEIMGLQHTELPVCGVQFHPESILTQQGMRIVKNFLEL